jgi:pentatricopeptide repeat protein
MDSPAVFSSILDIEKGGEMRVGMVDGVPHSQKYLRNTNVLVTSLHSASGNVEVIDFMPVERFGVHVYSRHEIHRIIRCTSGSVELDISFRPAFRFGTIATGLRLEKEVCIAECDGDIFVLYGVRGLKLEEGRATARVKLSRGKKMNLVLRWDGAASTEFTLDFSERLLDRTVKYWREWAGATGYEGRWKDAVIRSALVLKLLTYSPTGAICASATTSLPESVGGERNWDYRYSWIRDSTYALRAFNLLGHREEEQKYFFWLLHLLRGRASRPENLRVMYTVEGDPVPDEMDLPGLSGYRDSRPVRVGNGATSQLQIDIFGPVVDAIHFTFVPTGKVPDQMWRIVKSIAEYLTLNWMKTDMGIWEMRNGRKRHTHSTVMCWMALNRAAGIAKATGHMEAAEKWEKTAALVRETVLSASMKQGDTYISGTLEGKWLDSSVLVLPSTGIISAKDRRFVQTISTIEKHLVTDGLVMRYRGDDGLSGKEGAFSLCTFWYIDALCRAGKKRKAEELFERMIGRCNHLGLLSEEIDPATGEFLGNFPQAFSHLGLINTACLLQDMSLKK